MQFRKVQFNKSAFALVLGFIILCIPALASANRGDNSYNSGFLASERGNYGEAVAEWLQLAKDGHPVAQFNLALLYHSGDGVSRDEKTAVTLYHKSAEQGYHKAQEYLAAGYQEGWFGLPKDPQKAEYWSKRLQGKSK